MSAPHESSTAARPLVIDALTGDLFELMETYPTSVYIRPLLGGRELTRDTEKVREPTADELTAADGAALQRVADHERDCSACRARADGGYCPRAAALIRGSVAVRDAVAALTEQP
ncbi:hypothetical protein P3L51_34130 [Streptomyces sp. PSRA5]|uniref:hypothetical protein n=1 Tax=Streptomyces panacea TaxID=3035064 RepID=UPI00339C5A30